MPINTAIIIGSIFALAATIALCIAVLPKRKDGTFKSKFLQFLHNYFQFKTIYIEVVLKFIFMLATCGCIFCGFFLLFSKIDYWYYEQSTALTGLLVMILGPIILRIVYELTMLLVLLVKNVIEINGKLGASACASKKDGAPAFEAEKAEQPQVEKRFCPNCGAPYIVGKDTTCSSCGTELK